MVYYFEILIDITCSMDIWIERLRTQLFEFIQMCNFVDFKQINIISYSDYNRPVPIKSSGWQDLCSEEIKKFCNDMVTENGGGICECFKTALIHAISTLPESYNVETDHIYMLHITDSGPHNNELDIETMIDNINWSRISLTLEYVNYNSYKKSKYCKLDREGVREKRALKEDFQWKNIVQKCLDSNIIFNCITPFLDYFGCDLITKTNGYGYYQKTFHDNILPDIISAWFFNKSDNNFGYDEIANSFQNNYDNIGKDIIITNKFFDTIDKIIDTDIMLLTHNKVFGKMWRKLCKCRHHSSRNMVVDKMVIKSRLLNDANKEKFTEFMKESYNNTDEINTIMSEFNYNKILTYNSDIYEVTSSQDISRLFLDLGFNNQQIITKFTSRLSVREGNVLKPNEIPYDIPIDDLFSIIFHAMIPGSLLTGKFSIMTFAMLARKSILANKAKKLLNNNMGRWLNLDFSKDENLFPSIFNGDYLKLLLLNRDILTNEEINIIEKLSYLNLYKQLQHVVIPIKYIQQGSMDKYYPDHMVLCNTCHQKRPISLVKDSKCMYCVWKYQPVIVQTEDKCFMACCIQCDSFYSRDASINVMGLSRCHACLLGDKPEFKTCVKCNYKFIMYQDMPYNQCRNCLLGNSIRNPLHYEYMKTFTSVLPNDLLMKFMKINCSNTKSLYQMYKTCIDVDMTDNIMDGYKYNNHKITNMLEIYDTIKTSIDTKNIEREACSICCTDNILLMPACGRSKCHQKLCDDCGKQWYGENKKGCVMNLRHMTCMFCDREPLYKIIKRWGSDDIVQMQKIPEIDNSCYYAWCIKCNSAKICGARECGDAPPNLEQFICEDCVVPVPTDFKNCPTCEHPTVLTSGCNHITCICGTHWCFECGKKFSRDSIYDHMHREHGGIYRRQMYHDDVYYDDGYNTDDTY